MNIGNRIKILRENRGYSQTAFADKIGVSKQTLYKYENGIITNIPSDKIERIAEFCGTSPAYIMGWDDAPSLPPHDNIVPITTHKIPVLGTIACGAPIYAQQQFEYYVEVGTEIDADYAVHAKGDSMIGARIHSGDLVFIKEMPAVENGQIAAVYIDNEVTLKRIYYYPDKQKLVLQAENPEYEPLVYVGEELDQVRILGRAMAFQSDVK